MSVFNECNFDISLTFSLLYKFMWLITHLCLFDDIYIIHHQIFLFIRINVNSCNSCSVVKKQYYSPFICSKQLSNYLHINKMYGDDVHIFIMNSEQIHFLLWLLLRQFWMGLCLLFYCGLRWFLSSPFSLFTSPFPGLVTFSMIPVNIIMKYDPNLILSRHIHKLCALGRQINDVDLSNTELWRLQSVLFVLFNRQNI